MESDVSEYNVITSTSVFGRKIFTPKFLKSPS